MAEPNGSRDTQDANVELNRRRLHDSPPRLPDEPGTAEPLIVDKGVPEPQGDPLSKAQVPRPDATRRARRTSRGAPALWLVITVAVAIAVGALVYVLV